MPLSFKARLRERLNRYNAGSAVLFAFCGILPDAVTNYSLQLFVVVNIMAIVERFDLFRHYYSCLSSDSHIVKIILKFRLTYLVKMI
ncbi:hypothetical protein EV294_1011207 [Paenibacillus sp. BK033]|nr:hypothetical protein [Paenibacillus sp. BK720]TCN01747.1 hypothetical protein EV294_1011207 [Paenibacillus sp. BK033]